MHYVKLWSNLVRSSILEQELPVRWLWIVLLLEADQAGNVYGTQEALARIANLTFDEVKQALVALMAPDPSSTTEEEDGRRLLNPSPNLWYIVNYHKYRGIKDIAQERENVKERVRRHRERKRLGVPPVTPTVTSVTGKVIKVTRSNPIVDVDVEVDVGTTETVGASAPVSRPKKFTPPTAEEVQAYLDELGERRFSGEAFVDAYQVTGWKTKGGEPIKDWPAAVRNWRHMRDQRGEVQATPKGKSEVLCRDCHEPMTKPETMESTSCRACRKEHGV